MFYSFLQVVLRFFFKLVYRIELIGEEKINYGESIIFCANHKSYWDPVLLSAMLHEKVHWMAKKELFENRFLNFILPRFYAFPVDRKGNDIKALKQSMRILKNNGCLGIFPEGTRVKGYDEANVKDGVIEIAKSTGSAIVPLYIEGSYRAFTRVKVYVRDPMRIDRSKKYTSEEIHNEAVTLLKRIYGIEK